MAITMGSYGAGVFENCEATLSGSTINIIAPDSYVEFRFYAPIAYATTQAYQVNGSTYPVVKLNGETPLDNEWVANAPITMMLNEDTLYVQDV